MNTKEHAMGRYPSDPAGWGMAINFLCELATEKDVKRLSEYCSDTKYKKYLGDGDSEIFESWAAAFVGEIKYYLIRYGISRRFEWEREEEDPFRRFDGDEDSTGVYYYKVYHQWNAFRGWLTSHPDARESFNQFKVSFFK